MMDSFVQWDSNQSREVLIRKAKYLAQIRAYFDELNVVEVQTPALYEYPVSDPYLDCFSVETQSGLRYLQTSPEYAMKRMLSNGSGSIYQIAKAFRDDPIGRYHSYEFMMIEWYRVGIDDMQLMREIEQLILSLSPGVRVEYCSYKSLFEKHLNINPHQIDLSVARMLLQNQIGGVEGLSSPSFNDCLNLLFTHVIEPKLSQHELVFVYDYPSSQAALARLGLNEDGEEVGKRFEAYLHGVELANGYYELADAGTQAERFNEDLLVRQQEGKTSVPIDQELLLALDSGGFPECAGVAMGFERLVAGLEALSWGGRSFG